MSRSVPVYINKSQYASRGSHPGALQTYVSVSNSIWIIVKHIITSHRLGRLRKHSRVLLTLNKYIQKRDPRVAFSERIVLQSKEPQHHNLQACIYISAKPDNLKQEQGWILQKRTLT